MVVKKGGVWASGFVEVFCCVCVFFKWGIHALTASCFVSSVKEASPAAGGFFFSLALFFFFLFPMHES